MSIRQRAISEPQKTERRQAIIEGAWRAFQNTRYDAIMVAAIASGIGLAKGTVYSYFTTKEELFLGVLLQQLAHWFDTLDTLLQRRLTARSAARAITASLAERQALLRLLGMMNTTLEPNSSYAAVLAMKRMLGERLSRSGALLESALALHAGDGATTLLRLYALVIGVQHLATPSEVAGQVIRGERLRAFEIDFATELQAMLALLLIGAQHKAR